MVALYVCWPWASDWRCFGLYRSPDEAERIASTVCEQAAAYCVEEVRP